MICALFAALICISAYISVPLPLPSAPKITLLNFVVILITLLLPLPDSFLTVMVWMILGLIGIPVFIGGGSGIGYLLAPYGGYTLVYPIIAILVPLLRGKTYNRLRYTAVSLFAALLVDFLGMLWLMHVSSYDIRTGFLTGFLPFLPLDIIKAVIAAQIVPAFKRIMR